MKFNLNNKYIRWGITAFLVIVSSICFYYLLFHMTSIKEGLNKLTNLILPIMFGFITAYLLTPILNLIEFYILNPFFDFLRLKDSKKRKSFIRGIGIVLTTVFVFAIIYLVIYMLLSQIVPSIITIVSNFDSYITNFTNWINQLLADNKELGDYIIRLIDQYSDDVEIWLNETVLTTTSELIKTVSLSIIGLLGKLWDFIVGFVISIYVLASKEVFAGQAKKIVYAVFERPTANTVINNFRFTHKTFIGFISGKLLDSLIIGILCFIGTTLLNTPYAVLVSVVVGVTNVIPFFGPYLGGIPCTILVLVVDPMHPLNAVYFGIFVLLLQQFDGNILGPKILGDSTGLTGFWVIFSITLFGGMFGVPGMIIGVPTFAVIYAAVKSLVNNSLQKKAMSLETKLYTPLDYVDEEGGFHNNAPKYKMPARKEKKSDNSENSETEEDGHKTGKNP